MTFPPFASVYLIHRLVGKESACDAGDPGSIPGLGRSPGEGISYPLQYSWASLVAQLVKNPPAMWETWVGKIPWRRERLPTPVFWPEEFHELSPWGCKESDTTERLWLTSLTNPSITKRHYRNSSPASYVYSLRGRILSRCWENTFYGPS